MTRFPSPLRAAPSVLVRAAHASLYASIRSALLILAVVLAIPSEGFAAPARGIVCGTPAFRAMVDSLCLRLAVAYPNAKIALFPVNNRTEDTACAFPLQESLRRVVARVLTGDSIASAAHELGMAPEEALRGIAGRVALMRQLGSAVLVQPSLTETPNPDPVLTDTYNTGDFILQFFVTSLTDEGVLSDTLTSQVHLDRQQWDWLGNPVRLMIKVHYPKGDRVTVRSEPVRTLYLDHRVQREKFGVDSTGDARDRLLAHTRYDLILESGAIKDTTILGPFGLQDEDRVLTLSTQQPRMRPASTLLMNVVPGFGYVALGPQPSRAWPMGTFGAVLAYAAAAAYVVDYGQQDRLLTEAARTRFRRLRNGELGAAAAGYALNLFCSIPVGVAYRHAHLKVRGIWNR